MIANPNAWTIAFIVAFAILPCGILALAGIRLWFVRKADVYRYTWSSVWSVKSDETQVHILQSKAKRMAGLVIGLMVVATLGTAIFV